MFYVVMLFALIIGFFVWVVAVTVRDLMHTSFPFVLGGIFASGGLFWLVAHVVH